MWAKEIKEGVSAIVPLGMCVELEDFLRCARQFLMLQVLGKLKPKIKEGREHWPLEGDYGAEILVTGRFPFHISACFLSRGTEKFLLHHATSPSKNCFCEPFESNACVFTKPATGSA